MNPLIRRLFLAVLVPLACGRSLPPPTSSAPVDAGPGDSIVEVSVGALGHCTRSLLGRVECRGPGFQFTVVEAGARALSVGGMPGYCGVQTFACALLDGGDIRCAAHGNHVCEPRRSEVTIAGARAIAVGDYTSCALTAGGQVLCSESSPFEGGLHAIAGMQGAVAISCGARTCCALAGDGSVRCLEKVRGNLSMAPAVQVPLPVAAVAVTVGASHACALDADGHSHCWGEGAAAITPVGAARAISAGSEVTCALDAEGVVECFSASVPTPFSVPLVQMDVGTGEVCGLEANATVHCAEL